MKDGGEAEVGSKAWKSNVLRVGGRKTGIGCLSGPERICRSFKEGRRGLDMAWRKAVVNVVTWWVRLTSQIW